MEATGRVLGLNDGQPPSPAAAPSGYQPAGPQVAEGIRNGDIWQTLSHLPRMVVENLPDLGGALAAGRAGAMAGGALGSVVPGVGTAIGTVGGGLLGAGAYSFARGFGQNVEEHARNDGRTAPTTVDYVAGGATTLASAGLDAVGARGLGHAVSTPLSALGRARIAATAAGREGATEAAQSVVEQTGQTLGTARGLDVDPAEAIASGLAGAGTRSTLDAGHAAGGAVVAAPGKAVEALTVQRDARAMGDLTPERAASVERISRAYDQQAQATDREATPSEHLGAVREGLEADITSLVHGARDRGWTNDAQHRELSALLDTARKQNQALATGEAEPGSTPAGLARLEGMEGLPAEFRQGIGSLLQDLDTASQATRSGGGYFENLGIKAGRVAAVAGAMQTGNIFQAAGVLAGSPVASRIGGAIGRRLDGRGGTQTPAVVRARAEAQRILEETGTDPGDIGEMVQRMNTRLDDAHAAERHEMGLAADAEALAKEAAQMARTRATWTRRRVRGGLGVSEQELEGLTDRDRLDLLEGMRLGADREAQRQPIEAAKDAAQLGRQTAAEAARQQTETEAAWRQRDAAEAQEKGREADYSRALAALAPVAASPAQRLRSAQTAMRGLPPQEAPTAPAVVSPATATGPASGAALPGDPADALAPRPDGIFTGWRAGIMRFAAQHRGVVLAPRETDAALARLVERGDISEEMAQAAQEGDRMGRRTLELVTAEAMAGKVDPERPFAFLVPGGGGGGAGASEGARPVRNTEQFRSAAESYQASAARASERAHAAGDHELVLLLEEMAANSETTFPPAERMETAEALIASDPEQMARRGAALRPLLRRYR